MCSALNRPPAAVLYHNNDRMGHDLLGERCTGKTAANGGHLMKIANTPDGCPSSIAGDQDFMDDNPGRLPTAAAW